MTRQEFIEAYASRSGLGTEQAALGPIDGVLEVGEHCLIALPCSCGEDDCEGWAMVRPSAVPSHLELYAPEPIRSAFIALCTGGET